MRALNLAMPHSFDTVSTLIASIQNAKQENDPYRHWLLKDLLPEEVVNDLLTVSYNSSKLEYKVGTREENNSYRHYFDLESQEKFPVVKEVVDAFHSQEVLESFQKLCGVEFKGRFLRVEYAQDQEGFWLHPHTDIGVKMFTLLFYLNDEPQPDMWGTDIYKDAETFAKRIPFKRNTALLFVPGQNTWHGFEPRPMTGVRKTLIVNYVTDEWRNRHELASEEPIR